MSEVLFGQSYYLQFDPKLWAAMQPYPPLGTLYAASYLRSRGYAVDLFDATLAESEQEWAAALDRCRPRFAVIYEDNFNYLSKMCLLRMRQAAFNMIAMARQHGCTVILCGSDATDHYAEYLAQGADFVLLGEGEHTLGELLDRLSGRSSIPIEAIQGIAYAGRAEGSPSSLQPARLDVRENPRRPYIKDLDALPFPAWDLVDLPRYRQIWLERHGYFSMNLVTTRGCPYHCNWCAKPIWGQRYNVRSPENVVAELKWLKERYDPDHIWFMDDILGLKPGWMKRFAELVQAEGIAIPYKCLNRVDLLLRPGEIDAFRQSGCQIVWVGAESGSQKILDAMDKGTRVDQIREASSRLRAAGIQVGFFLQFGYPGETRADIEKTFQLVRDCQPDDIGMSVSYPLPGTKFYETVKQQLGSRQNWIDSNDLAMLYQGPFSTAFYRQLHTTLHKEFRAGRAFHRLISRKGKSAEPGEQNVSPSLNRWRDLAVFCYHLASLPIARWKLNRLAGQPHRGIEPLPAIMTPEAAARPTPQGE